MLAHRDVKPENLLIGARQELQITDFGLSTMWLQSLRRELSGTPSYMAPEQWTSGVQTMQTDLYAFGVVLHELCFGRLPWTTQSVPELADAHLHHRPRIDAHPLAGVIGACMAKSPAERPNGAEGLLRALGEVAKANRLVLPPRPELLDEEQSELLALASSGAVGDSATALQAAKTLTQRWPNYAPGWTQLGRIYCEMGDFTSAQDATRRSLAIDPTRSAPWNNLGLQLAKLGSYEASVQAFKRALDSDPDNTGAMGNVAEPLRALRRYGEAVDYLVRATALAPDKYSLWANLGSTYSVLDMNDNAVDALRRAWEVAPDERRKEISSFLEEVQARPKASQRGAALLLEGRVAEAIPVLGSEARAEPNNPAVVQNFAFALLQSGQDDAARGAFENLYRIEPENQLVWMRLMQLASKRGDLSEASRWCDKYASVPGMLGRSKAFRAYVLEQCGHVQSARKLLLEAMKEHPEEPDIYVAYGDLAIKQSVPHFAVDAYRAAIQCIRLQPHDIERLREVESRLEQAIAATRNKNL